MPDLQSELSKVINDWSEPEMTQPTSHPTFAAPANTSRATAEYVMANPGLTRKEICDNLSAQGHHRATVYALLVQMSRQNRITEVNGTVTAKYTEYTPLMSFKAWAKMQAAAQPRKHVTLVSKSTGKVFNPRPAQEAPQINSAWDADVMLNSLSIVQARALYDSLRKIFGG